MVIAGQAAPFQSARPGFPTRSTGIKGRVGIRIVGDDKLQVNLTRMSKLPQEGITKIVQLMASEFLATLTVLAPKQTGRYINSWRVKENSANRVIVGPVGMLPPRETVTGGQTEPIAASRLARMLEFTGSPAHTIEPRVADNLVYSQNGEIRVRRKVNHPGFRPIPHIRPALADTRRKGKGIAYAVASEYMAPRMWNEAMIRAARAEGYQGPIPPRQTGRNRKDTSANIGRGTKANLKAKLSRPGLKTKIVARGKTRAVGTNENFSARKGASRLRQQATRYQSVGLYSQ